MYSKDTERRSGVNEEGIFPSERGLGRDVNPTVIRARRAEAEPDLGMIRSGLRWTRQIRRASATAAQGVYTMRRRVVLWQAAR